MNRPPLPPNVAKNVMDTDRIGSLRSLRQVMEMPFRDRIATMKTTPHEQAEKEIPVLCEEINSGISGIEVL